MDNGQNHDPVSGFPDLIDIIALLLRNKIWIVLATVICVLSGCIYLIFATRTYTARTVIIPKNSNAKGGSEFLSQLGGLGGLLGKGPEVGITSMKRLELSALSREIAIKIVEKHNLLPRIFPDRWNPETKNWKDTTQPLDSFAGYDEIVSNMLSVSPDPKTNLFILSIRAPHPQLAYDLVKWYQEELNDKMRDDVIKDSKANLAFLESQFININDPELRGKLQDLMAGEIERSMLVSAHAFEIFEQPILPGAPQWPRKGMILGLSGVMGILLSVFGILAYTFMVKFLRHLRARMAA